MAFGRSILARRFSTWLFQIAVNLCRDWHRRPPPEPHDPDTLAEIRAGMDPSAILVFRDQPFTDDQPALDQRQPQRHLLTAHVGGTSWTQSYDAALGRFALAGKSGYLDPDTYVSEKSIDAARMRSTGVSIIDRNEARPTAAGRT